MRILYLTILLSFCLYGCSSFPSSSEKLALDHTKIERIYIYKNYDKIEKIYLTKNEAEAFVINWNSAKIRGPCKYRVAIWAIAKLNNGNNRKFRISANNIKGESDYCYTFTDEFSEVLYEKIR